ncbi:hypothetical protein [Kribbella deserti]|uniref:Uncharacterized protein n=1 Tax=Kribbella deserti TaxID=1926257 RepID=A0ABV6QMI5_9ACTN
MSEKKEKQFVDPTPKRPEVEEILRRQAEVAVALSGADHSSFSGKVLESVNGPLGAAHWNGDMELNVPRVIDQLNQMYATAGQQHDERTLWFYKDTIDTLLHENSHMLSGPGTEHVAGAQAYQTGSGTALEEGVTEAWTKAHLNEYIERLGVDKIAPGIKEVSIGNAYPQYTPAAQAFATGLGADTGLGQDEVLRRLNGVNAAEKWPMAARMAFEASDLPQRLPAVEHETTRNRIEQAMRAELEPLRGLTGDRKMLALQSELHGLAAVRSGRAEISAMREAGTAGPAAEVATEQAKDVQAPKVDPELQRMMALANGGTTPLQSVSANVVPAGDSAKAAKPAGRPGPEMGRD